MQTTVLHKTRKMQCLLRRIITGNCLTSVASPLTVAPSISSLKETLDAVLHALKVLPISLSIGEWRCSIVAQNQVRRCKSLNRLQNDPYKKKQQRQQIVLDMGNDCPTILTVIHFGPASSIEDYIQGKTTKFNSSDREIFNKVIAFGTRVESLYYSTWNFAETNSDFHVCPGE